MTELFLDLLLLVGLSVIAVGIALIYLPAGVIFAGGALVYLAQTLAQVPSPPSPAEDAA